MYEKNNLKTLKNAVKRAGQAEKDHHGASKFKSTCKIGLEVVFWLYCSVYHNDYHFYSNQKW